MRVSKYRIPPRGLIVSCQALEDEPLHGSIHMAVMARAALMGGAVAIRANGPEDIRAIREITDVPIIGLYKLSTPGFGVYITPTFESARAVKDAGADIIAIDATRRPRPDGSSVQEMIRRIHEELGVAVMADISTLEEGIAAVEAGADLVSTTLSGYTPYSRSLEGPDFELVEELVHAIDVPVIVEGRIWTPEEASRAIRLGAYAVVVGGAITRPQMIAGRFARAVAEELQRHGKTSVGRRNECVVGVDIGGTSIKAGLVDSRGHILTRVEVPTNARGGATAIASSLRACLTRLLASRPDLEPRAIGVGSAGQIDPSTGIVVSATPNLPGWQGTDIPKLVRECLGRELPVLADNDANVAAYGEYLCGAGQGCSDLVCLTIGTGVGGGIIASGKLIRGAFGGGAELGHMSIDANGPPCNCGSRGCIEAYISGWAIAARTGGKAQATDVFDAAVRGDGAALAIVREIGIALGYAIVNIANILQPQRVILGGSIGERAEMFMNYAREVVASRALPCAREHLEIVKAALGKDAGIVGAGMLAWRDAGVM